MLNRIKIALLLIAGITLLAGFSALASPAHKNTEDPLVRETGWGQACARGMLKFYEGKVDIALISGGELPALGPMPKVGEVPDWENLKDLDFVLIKISGADLLIALERSVKYMPRKNANLLHIQGLTVFCERADKTNMVRAATVGAEPIVPSETYRVATTKFLAEGGGAFVGLKSLELVTKEPHSLARQIRFLFFPKGKISAPKPSYIFPAAKDA